MKILMENAEKIEKKNYETLGYRLGDYEIHISSKSGSIFIFLYIKDAVSLTVSKLCWEIRNDIEKLKDKADEILAEVEYYHQVILEAKEKKEKQKKNR